MKRIAAYSPFTLVLFTLVAAIANTGCSPGPPRHGTAFIVSLNTNQLEAATTEREAVIVEVQEVLRKRFKEAGINRPFLQMTNDGQLLILLPSLDDSSIAVIRKLVERPGILEFRMVHPDSDELIRENIIEGGYQVLRQQKALLNGTKQVQEFLVARSAATATIGEKRLAMTGKYLKRAMVTRDPLTRQSEIDFELDAEGAEIFRLITP